MLYYKDAVMFPMFWGIIFIRVQPREILFEFYWTLGLAQTATPKNDLPPGGHIFITTETIFELIQDIIGTYRLTKFHKDKKINVAWRVLTRFTNSHRWKNAPPTGSYVFRPTGVIFEVVKDIVGMNLLAKFNEDRTIHVAPVVFTRFYYSHIQPYKENCPDP